MRDHTTRPQFAPAWRTRAAWLLSACCAPVAFAPGLSQAAATCAHAGVACVSSAHPGPEPAVGPLHAVSGGAASARGALPELRFDQTSLDFGTVDTGSSGLLLTAVLVNDSSSAEATQLHFESDPAFPLVSQFGTCEGMDLGPREACSVRIKFAPTAPGPVTGALIVTSNESAQAVLPLSGTGGDDHVLYAQWHDWDNMPGFWGWLDTTYSETPDYTAEMAEDFVVDDPAGWTISKVGLEVFVIRSDGPPEAEAIILDDAGGVPGTEDLCPASASSVVMWEPPFDESRAEIELTPACVLPPGHYWLQVRFLAGSVNDENSFYGWGLQYVMKPVEPPPVHLDAPVWRQPGGGSGYPGCFDWTPLSPPNCGLEDYQPYQTAYGVVFWLVGQTVRTDPIFTDGFDP
jgi:hypothetical protein